jgi:hypothetical protein
MCHHHHPHPHHAATEHDNADWTADHGSSSTTMTTTACDDGARDAEAAAARANFVTYGISVVGHPLMGSYSDRHGRRPFLLFALGVSCVPAVIFYWLVQVPTLPPIWYYVRKNKFVHAGSGTRVKYGRSFCLHTHNGDAGRVCVCFSPLSRPRRLFPAQ